MHPKLLEESLGNKDMALAWYTAWYCSDDAHALRVGDKSADTSLKFKARGIVEHDRRLITSEQRVQRVQHTIDLLEGKHG